MNEDDFKANFEKFINSTVLVDNKVLGQLKNTIENKIGILERFIELYRSYSIDFEDKISLTNVLDLDVDFVENGTFRIVHREISPTQRKYLSPHDLELPLLLFLLVYGKTGDVYSVICDFIKEIRPLLRPLDFEKTRTGVVRCFTNTRFAAQTLRSYGLLKFTKEEAFRTWKLSFLGIAVSSLIYHPEWSCDFELAHRASYGKDYFRLLSTINAAMNIICDKDKFVALLHSIIQSSNPDVTYDSQALNELCILIGRYQDVLKIDYKEIAKNKCAIKIIDEMEERKTVANLMCDFKTAYELKDFNKKINELIRGRYLPGK